MFKVVKYEVSLRYSKKIDLSGVEKVSGLEYSELWVLNLGVWVVFYI